jgi:anti-sigma factor RsiW
MAGLNMDGSNMTCSNPLQKPDWNAYALGEMNADARRSAEAHGASCDGCREELATLRLTLDAMSTLREEEVPRRIAFVSDKVFEPRWWQVVFSPTFAAAALVALAILAHGFMQPGLTEAQMQARVDKAVSQAMTQVDAQQQDLQMEVRLQRNFVSQMYASNTGLVR